MSERLTIHQEHSEKHTETSERREHLPVHAEHHPTESAEAHHKKLAESRQHAQAEAKSGNSELDKLRLDESAAAAPTPQHVNQELKQITLRRELRQIRRNLPAPQRLLSQVIHQPAVRAVSEVTAKSISRPSGLLGGGLVAFIGSTGYLYLAKHIGFRYNYGVFVILFIGGFIIGLALELLVYMATTSRHQRVD